MRAHSARLMHMRGTIVAQGASRRSVASWRKSLLEVDLLAVTQGFKLGRVTRWETPRLGSRGRTFQMGEQARALAVCFRMGVVAGGNMEEEEEDRTGSTQRGRRHC